MSAGEAGERQIELVKADTQRKKIIRQAAKLTNSNNLHDSLGKGKEGSVDRVIVVQGEKAIPGFAFKEYTSAAKAAYAFKVYTRLKALDLPVPPTFRLVIEDGRYKGILMTDLTAGWNDILISSNETKRYTLEQVQATNPSTIRLFSDKDLRDPQMQKGMDETLKHIARLTAENHMRFDAGDVVCAIFTHVGTLTPIISDMGSIVLDAPDSFDDLYIKNLRIAGFVTGDIGDAQRIARELVKT